MSDKPARLYFFSYVLIVAGVCLALISINEITARQDFVSLLQGHLNHHREEKAVAEKRLEAVPVDERGTTETARLKLDLRLSAIEVRNHLNWIDDIRNLQVLGVTTDSLTLRATVSKDNVSTRFAIEEMRLEGEGVARPRPMLVTADSTCEWVKSLFLPRRMSSDRLLAIALCSASIAGALFMESNRDSKVGQRPRRSKLSAGVAGLVSGFLIFIVIKSGKGIFMLDVEGTFNQFNPYACTALSFLFGCGSESLYETLKSYSDKVRLGLQLASLDKSVIASNVEEVQQRLGLGKGSGEGPSAL